MIIFPSETPGYSWVLYEDEQPIHWKDCEVPRCEWGVCYGLSSRFCFKHTPGNKHVKHMKIDALIVGVVEKETA